MTSATLLDRSTVRDHRGALNRDEITAAVEETLVSTPFIDVHTHLYMPSLGAVGLWGIDELITYHYLEAEFFRSSSITPEQYWRFSKTEKADAIWRVLFVENAPVSEATRGVVAVLQALGLPTTGPDLTEAREFFASQSLDSHIRRVFDLAGISEVVMTNDPLDPDEAPLWERGADSDRQFHPVLRLDRILNKWATHWRLLESQGYAASEDAGGRSVAEVRRFLLEWCMRMRPVTWPFLCPIPSCSPKTRYADACSPKRCCRPAESSAFRCRS